MSFIDGLVRDHLHRQYPGREFSAVYSDAATGGYAIYEYEGRGMDLRILRTAHVDPRILGLRPTAEGARAVCRSLDRAFDLRTDAERLPWQLFADYLPAP